MSKFFINAENIHDNSIIITGDDVDHIRKVLRLGSGDRIVLSDGMGNDYMVKIERYESGLVYTSIVSVEKSNTEPPIEITLFQGIPKSDKMDFIVQKSVELGVKRIVPVMTARTVVRFAGDKDMDSKVKRWQRISLEAAKQCNRGIVPKIDMPLSIEEALEVSADADFAVIPYEKEARNHIKSLIGSELKKAAVFIGPEGGFTEEEVEKALLRNVKPVTLGPRILRTETAGIVVLSILMYELGDMGKGL